MLEILNRKFLYLDGFGSKFYFRVQSDNTNFRTIIGVISSIGIYTVSAIYLIYLITIFAREEIPPTVS